MYRKYRVTAATMVQAYTRMFRARREYGNILRLNKMKRRHASRIILAALQKRKEFRVVEQKILENLRRRVSGTTILQALRNHRKAVLLNPAIGTREESAGPHRVKIFIALTNLSE